MESSRWGEMMEIVNKQAMMETFVDILLCSVPIWVAIMIGLIIGWSWRPRWTGLVFMGLFKSKKFGRFVWTIPPGLGARRVWLAFTALSVVSVGRRVWNSNKERERREEDSGEGRGLSRIGSTQSLGMSRIGSTQSLGMSRIGSTQSLGSERSNAEISNTMEATSEEQKGDVTEDDLKHLVSILEGKDGEMVWQSMMERSTSNMSYQAWRHETQSGVIVLRSKTIFEDAAPEMVRDFFWDDEFRPKWDNMLAHVKILEENPDTGMMIIHWIKKFPFFCSDREYIIGRRIWESGNTLYCVTKGIPYPDLQRRDKPRRVDMYFSSWVIRPVQSLKGDGQLSACEVTLIHYEDMGIPKDVAKLGVRHGMWGTVKKLHSGFRTYQNLRNADDSPSRCALMAGITTKMSTDDCADIVVANEEERDERLNVQRQQGQGAVHWKWLVVGGTVALVCGLNAGLIGKVLLVGAGQRVTRRRGNSR